MAICDDWCVEAWEQARWDMPAARQSGVYLLFRFASDAAEVSYGAFVDDVSLEAYYEGVLPTVTATATIAGAADHHGNRHRDADPHDDADRHCNMAARCHAHCYADRSLAHLSAARAEMSAG